MAAKRSKVDVELERLKAGTSDPHSKEAAAALAVALGSAHARVVASAAKLIKARQLDGLTDALRAAWPRFLEEPVKRDPGCLAKVAILEALDFTEVMGEEPFLSALTLTQPEAAWGPPVDTAAPCRARAVLALARQGHPDVVLHAALLLADPFASVRVAAADALGGCGVHHAAGVLLLKLEVGDEDPLVRLACVSGVLALSPELALHRFAPLLATGDEEEREVVALAFGQSNRADACAALIAALEACPVERRREVLLRGLGLHRSDAALEALLGVIARPGIEGATAAIRALAPRRFEPGVRAKVEQAIAGRVALTRVLNEAFRIEDS